MTMIMKMQNSIIPYEDLPKYDLFLSQVTEYLNDKFKDENFTNSIIQNYIKLGIISKPLEGKKKGYTRQHMVQLVLLAYMRPVLSTEEIRKVFSLAFNEINNYDDDIISWEKAYRIFEEIQKEIIGDTFSGEAFSKEYLINDKTEKYLKTCGVKEEDSERIKEFLSVMTLIAQASVIKNYAKGILDKKISNDKK